MGCIGRPSGTLRRPSCNYTFWGEVWRRFLRHWSGQRKWTKAASGIRPCSWSTGLGVLNLTVYVDLPPFGLCLPNPRGCRVGVARQCYKASRPKQTCVLLVPALWTLVWAVAGACCCLWGHVAWGQDADGCWRCVHAVSCRQAVPARQCCWALTPPNSCTHTPDTPGKTVRHRKGSAAAQRPVLTLTVLC